MGNLYKKYAKGDVKNKDGGYKNKLLIAPADTFILCALPDPGVDPLLGDDVKIVEDHTFGAEDGFIEILGKTDTATSKYTTDEEGIATHTVEIDIEGDSPELYAQLKKMRSDNDNVILIKDGNCIAADSYSQFGDDCLQAKIKVDFDAKTTAGGTKIHKLTATIREHKYWYYGTVTEKAAAAALSCPVISLSATANTVIVNFGDTGAHHYEVKLFSNASGVTQVGATAVLAAADFSHTFTALTTATQYYVRVIPVAADGTKKNSCGIVGILTT
jgi:hypothetical protein